MTTEETAKEIVGKWGYEEEYWWKPIQEALDLAIQSKVKSIREEIGQLGNPYPEDLFPEVEHADMLKVAEFCNREGINFTHMNGSIARWQRNLTQDNILNIPSLQLLDNKDE